MRPLLVTTTRHPHPPSRRLVPVLALASLLALTACTADDAAPEDGTDETTTAPDGGGEDGNSAPDEGETGEDDGTSSDGAAALGGPGCLEGTWEVDPETSREAVLAIPGFDDGVTEVDVTGTVTLTFDGETMTSRYEDQATVLSMEAEGSELVMTTTVDGEAVGSYTATEDTLTVEGVETDDLSVTTTTAIDGEEVEVPELTDTPDYGFALESVSGYECTATELRLTPQVEGTEGLVQVLTRRD